MVFTWWKVTGMGVARISPLIVMQWYYSSNNTQCGPVSNDELRAKLASGEVAGADMVWREGLPDWCPANSLPELAVAAPGPPPIPVDKLLDSAACLPPASCPAPADHIPNYLWQAIVVTIFCCWPCGIPAIVYAAKVDGLRARGDFQGARSAAANAKLWCWISFGAIILLIIPLLISLLIPALVSSHH